MASWLRRTLTLLGCLAVLILCLFWWFLHATPGQYGGFFNFIYRHPMGAFKSEANGLLAETAASLAQGRALDVAMGEGRNAVYLAARRWDVTGFDVSGEALRQANAHAKEAGVRIQTVLQSSEAFDYGRQQWDLILFSYAFAPIHEPAYVRRIRDALKPGGVVVYEHYTGVPGVEAAVGMVGPGELPRLFADFEIRRYEETRAKGDWQFGRRAQVTRLVAAKRQDQ